MHFPVSRARLTAESRNAGARVAVLSFVSFERSPACERLNRRLAALLATTALVAVAVLVPGAARAQDATWLATPGSGDFNTAANWNPAAVPTGTAFFGTSSVTGLSFSANSTFGGWTFNSGAPAYTFSNGSVTLSFTGAGIVIDGGSATISNDGLLAFSHGSTAGSATIINTFGMLFHDGSTAGSASITSSGLVNFFESSTAGSSSITNSGTLIFNNSTTAGSAGITNANAGSIHFVESSTAGSSSITNNNSGSISFFDTSTAGSATITNNHFLSFNNSSTAGSATITNTNTGTLNFISSSSAGSASITNAFELDFNNTSTAGSATITNNSLLNFSDASTAGSASITNNRSLEFTHTSTAGSATITTNNGMSFSETSTAGSATIINTGTLDFFDSSTAGSATITTNSGGISFIENSASGGTARFIVNGTGFLDISQITTGGTTAGSIEGDGRVFLGSKNLAVGGNNLSTTFSGAVKDAGFGGGTGGSLTKIGTGTLTLSGVNTYTGATVIDAGTLAVNGSIASSSQLTVNASGTLGGNGIVGNTTIGGGTLAPGNSIGTLTVSGSLTLAAASTYLVQVSGTSSDKTIVTGTANLAGKVTVDPLARVAATTTYTILTAGTVRGTFVTADFLTTNNFARNARLSYVGDTVLLTVDPGLLSPSLSGAGNINQRNVAAGIDNALIGGSAMPAAFNALFALSGDGLLNALTQASGETATGSQQATFDAMNLFVGVLSDPFVAGRGDGAGAGTTTPGYAEEGFGVSAYAPKDAPRSQRERDAYAAIYHKTLPMADPFTQRWSVWAAGYGGSQTTDGNAALGSNTATSSIAGTVVGADYRISPFTIAGFALAGGGTSFSVAGSGSGHSDLFQAGAFIRHTVGQAYISGTLAYGWQDITTNRTVSIAGIDQLRAEFDANAFSGRLEGGYRFVSPLVGGIGLTPYAAAQFTTFDLPAYAEQATVGSNAFALAYNAKDVTDARSELGIRTDKSWAMQGAILTLRSRFAWAHDFDPDRSIGATFQTLPGASFVVNGAAQAHDSALTTASVEMKWMNGWSAAATFEGEFSEVTRSYAGKGVVRYAW
jgi:autotransporter-associated beta strand protein